MPESSKISIFLEMGYSHEDFVRTLAILMDGRPYSVCGTRINIPQQDSHVDISLGEQGERRIGPTLRLPRTPVEIVFCGYSDMERKRFMKRFEMIFRRGGG